MDTEDWDDHDLYERSVQDAEASVQLLERLHGGSPRVLGEDFAGTAALSRAWVARGRERRAYAVDRDPRLLARAGHPQVAAHVLDVRSAELARLAPCDVVHAGNFSIGELGSRAEVLGWARTARARLAPGGLLAVDTYAGESAWRRGALERRRALGGGIELRWTWEQRRADPLTARVENALSFRVLRDGEVVQDRPEAFVYGWRLWSPAELTDALAEAGFRDVEPVTCVDGSVATGASQATGCVVLLAARDGSLG
ncbi:MAG: class I SAM-dependent methyltransferase [Planctomycetes bacterium]|nr:class I SAM-dependent methyltransferase [Planctomycetota bacterium]